MKIALVGDEVICAETGSYYDSLRDTRRFRWNRSDKTMRGDRSLLTLQALSSVCRLPPHVDAVRQNMARTQAIIDGQRRGHSGPLMPMPVRAKLMEHQVAGANMALAAMGAAPDCEAVSRGFGLLYEMGCGKTLAAIAVMGALWQAGLLRRCIVAAPGTVVPVWGKELEQFAAFPFRCTALTGTKAQRLKRLKEASQDCDGVNVVVVNYEATFRDGLFQALMNFGGELVICDESQRIKNPKAKQTVAMTMLADKAAYRLALTGTPVQQGSQDVFAQFRFLDKAIFGDNFHAFRNRYCKLGGFGGKEIVGIQNEDELSARMRMISYRVTKAEALDLPEETYTDRIVELSPAERRAYDQLKASAYLELSAEEQVTATTVLTKLLRLQQIAGGFVRPDDSEAVKPIGTSKLEALEDIVDDYVVSENRKIVIFARFLPEIEAICQMLSKKGIQVANITGAVPQAERGPIVDRFQEDPQCLAFVAQLQTAGLGITLHAASLAVFYSVDFNYANYQQATARIHRKGQRHPCTYIHLVAENTVDNKILRALSEKGDVAATICDRWQEYFE